ncbi:XRE family transcriptional regulator [Corallococcus aberystwythensis]|uniref:XRE family transcriptional regulator n=2 Tax=Corallococcus aberystwythensis TaxID=2316722 RepID=A0A3A8Q3L0_9BACT|nr:XRE family transcriptional regulator [Corallococcus aberystwythensis]
MPEMPSKKRNQHVDGSLQALIERRKADSPTFATLYNEEFNKLALARQVRELREKQGLSQTELAERAGTKQPAIARLESGRVVPRLDLLQKIAHALGMQLELRFVKSS